MKYSILLTMLVLSLALWGCASKKSNTQQPQNEQASAQSTNGSGLTPFQMKNGIGPVTKEVKAGPLNKELAAKGEKIFESNCTACHKLGKRYVGPNLQEVTSRRTPTYIMNMILNPEGMTHKHPVAQKLLAKFATQMANRHLTKTQARAVVEYLRSVNPNTQK
ncbi:MAG TPA: c-type cytochrome [Balneolales bacterium]|jgi:mono/diheme cytochrome c family protein|nr:c-type cytochrome [Balneolales bacterium]